MLKKIGEETCTEASCLLCIAKCPSCGSDDIRIRFAPVYEAVRKSSNNEINIVLKNECLMIECSKCGKRFGRRSEYQEKNPSIEHLEKSFLKYLNLPSDATVKTTSKANGTHKTTVTLVCPLD